MTRPACAGATWKQGGRFSQPKKSPLYGIHSCATIILKSTPVEGSDMRSRIGISLVILAALVNPLNPQRIPATGPLRMLASNPRWFTDGNGRAVYLAGSPVWQSLQDNGLLLRYGGGNPPPVFNFERYLQFLEHHHHNFFRLWRWEITKWTDSSATNMV